MIGDGRMRAPGGPRLMRVERASEPSASAALGDDLVGRVEATALETAPFAHIYMEQVFRPAYYRALLYHLPETRHYRELRHQDAMQADGYSARRKFYLYPEHIMLLPAPQRAFWLPLSRALLSRELEAAFKRKFRAALERRFERPIERLSFYPIPILLRDL